MRVTQMEFLKKLKRFSPVEQSLGILVFFLVTFLIVGCFFYLDYSTVSRGFLSLGQIQRQRKSQYFFIDGGSCDLFDGSWVWDDSYPLYYTKDCSFMDVGFRCAENGRPDSFYTKWRWQPKDCNLPRFDAKHMLEKLKNRRLVFVGDSIGRNQWESLLCLLSSVVKNKSSIYEVNGNPITKHMGFLVFKITDYNCTVEYYRSTFLVLQSRAPSGSPEQVKTTIKLDQMEWTSPLWKDADVLIFNTGHWWNYEKTLRVGCYFQEGEDVKMEMSVESAYRRSIETLVKWIDDEVNTNKTQIYFRTFAPVHFRGGDWKTGGSCHLETLPEMEQSPVSFESWPQYVIAMDVLSKHVNKSSGRMSIDLLNVTYMSSRRKDGHLSLYYLGPTVGPSSIHRQDCSHWCLPGVPDAWNELLYALILKQEYTHSRDSREPSQTPVFG